MLRVADERLHEPSIAADEYVMGYQLTPERLKRAKADAIVLHPGPMIRGLEIDPAVADGEQSCVLEQVTNGLAVRMALLYHLGGRGAFGAGADEGAGEVEQVLGLGDTEKGWRMLLIKNGRVIDPASGVDAVQDVLLDNGVISKVGANLSADGAEIFDASGLVVAPGFIDLHVHLREPGQELSETIETGTRTAARGGLRRCAACRIRSR